jgi:ubiquinone/menaquinone biosynthesis C-methylase UbiE
MFNEIQRVLKPDGRFLVSDSRRSWSGILTRQVRSAYSAKETGDFLGQPELQDWKVRDPFFWLTLLSEVRTERRMTR